MQEHKERNYKIRRATPADASLIIRLINEADTESVFMTREPGEFDVTLEAEQRLLANQDEERAWIVADTGSEIVGLVNVDRVHTRRRLRHRATLGLVVRQAYWGQGIGRSLLEQAVAWAKSQDIEQIELGVIMTNKRALTLYTDLGFQETGRLDHVFKYKDGTYADEIQMVLRLRS